MHPVKRKNRSLALGMLALSLMAFLLPQTAYAATPADVVLTLEQSYIDAPGATGSFDYALTADWAGNPMPLGGMGGAYPFQISGNEVSHTLPAITFTTTGIYYYTIRHLPPPAPPVGYVYDDTEYHVLVAVSADDATGDLSTMVAVYENSLTAPKVPAIAYHHPAYYLSDPSLMTYPPVNVTVRGSASTPQVFTFFLSAQDIDNPMPAGSVDGVSTLSILGAGSSAFKAWVYTAPGTYNYTLWQQKGRATNYTYDDTVFTITDVVAMETVLKKLAAPHGGVLIQPLGVARADTFARPLAALPRGGGVPVNQLVVTRTVTNNRTGAQVRSCDFVNFYARKHRGDGPKPAEIPEEIKNPTSGSGGFKGEVDIPKTGDETAVGLWIAFLIIADIIAIACLYHLLRRKKRKKEQE